MLLRSIVVLAWLLASSAMAHAEPRLALMIANSNYGAAFGTLANPRNDADLVSSALRQAGFEVVVVIDADQKTIKRAISDFGKRLTAAGEEATALFYYAGHGVQVDGVNYIIPVDAEIATEADVDLEAVAADAVLKQLEFAGVRLSIIVLDACRNNPLARSMRSGTRGLARMDAPTGSFVAYSTAPGAVAQDGAGMNSPFAMALAEEILRPGPAIEETFRNVRTKVMAATGNEQVPWDSSSVTGPFHFTPSSGGSSSVAPPPTGDAGATSSAEIVFWNSIQMSQDPADFEAYLKKYREGEFAELAKNKIRQLKTTEQASTTHLNPPAQQTSKEQTTETGPIHNYTDAELNRIPTATPITAEVAASLRTNPVLNGFPAPRLYWQKSRRTTSSHIMDDEVDSADSIGGLSVIRVHTRQAEIANPAHTGEAYMVSLRLGFLAVTNNTNSQGYFSEELPQASTQSYDQITRFLNVEGGLFPMSVGRTLTLRYERFTNFNGSTFSNVQQETATVREKLDCSKVFPTATGKCFRLDISWTIDGAAFVTKTTAYYIVDWRSFINTGNPEDPLQGRVDVLSLGLK